MSHFTVYDCNVSNVDYIKKALEEMGLGHKTNTKMTDWYGQTRQAEIAVVQNGKVLPLGWLRNEQDELQLQADWFDCRGIRQADFTQQVQQLHAKYQVLDTCQEAGWSVDINDINMNSQGEIEILATSYR